MKWQAEIRLTPAEALRCWQCEKPPSRRRWVYTCLIVLLLADEIYMMLKGPVEWRAVLVSLLLVVVLAVLWIRPWWQRRQAIRRATCTTLLVAADDTEISFGRDDPVRFRWDECRLVRQNGLAVVIIGDQRVGIPQRAVNDTVWDWLSNR